MSPTKLLMGVRDGVLTVVDPRTERGVTLPWPPPDPKDDRGSWQPAVLQRYPDGTALAVWRWEEFRDGRADEPPAQQAAE